MPHPVMLPIISLPPPSPGRSRRGLKVAAIAVAIIISFGGLWMVTGKAHSADVEVVLYYTHTGKADVEIYANGALIFDWDDVTYGSHYNIYCHRFSLFSDSDRIEFEAVGESGKKKYTDSCLLSVRDDMQYTIGLII